MPSLLHDSHQNWIRYELYRMNRTGYLKVEESKQLKMFVGTSMYYIKLLLKIKISLCLLFVSLEKDLIVSWPHMHLHTKNLTFASVLLAVISQQ
jgi:hypothetical protein